MVEHRLAKVEGREFKSRLPLQISKDEGGRMKDESSAFTAVYFILPPSSFILSSGGVAKW